MKLCSIINTWIDTLELLPYAIENHLKFCDGVIVVFSTMSNHGNGDDGKMMRFIEDYQVKGEGEVIFLGREPSTKQTPLVNETRKRNEGIEEAKRQGYTHILISDSDEFWRPQDMEVMKEQFDLNVRLSGFVHPLRVFIKSPTLWCEDHTLVPGIQKLRPDFQVGNFKEFPYAYEKDQAHIDPSRRPNTLGGIAFSPTPMFHYSYVRKNIDLKIDNSSANLRRSRQTIYDELRDAKPGYISKLYHQPLQETENYFGIEI